MFVVEHVTCACRSWFHSRACRELHENVAAALWLGQLPLEGSSPDICCSLARGGSGGDIGASKHSGWAFFKEHFHDFRVAPVRVV